jgi:predicted MFS family arabinose efflux permease
MDTLRHNLPLRLLLITNSLILLSAAMLGPIYALFVEDIGGDLMDASIAGSIFALVAGLTTLISGRYSDKVKENELIVALGYCIIGTGFFLYTIADSVYFIFCIQALVGLGEAIYSPAFDALYSKHLDGHKSGAQWGIWESMNYFSIATGATLGGTIVTLFGFDTLFILMASLSFGSGLYIVRLNRNIL